MELGTPYITHGAAAKRTLDEHDSTREIAGFWGYLLQIIYQVREASTPPNGLKYYPLENLFMFLIGEGHRYCALTFADLVLHTWRGSSFAFQVPLLVPGSYHDALTTKALLGVCAHGLDSVSEDQMCPHTSIFVWPHLHGL